MFVSLGLSVGTVLAKGSVGYNPSQLDQFTKTNQCAGCDLSSADLSCLGTVINHSGANLNNANLSNASFGGDLSEANLENTNLSNVVFRYINLSSADLTGAALYGADLAAANLYNAKITATQLAEVYSLCNAILPDGSKGKCN